MVNEAKLGFGEFLRDIRGVITSPRQRFSVIHERGALWGSIFLLIAPAYFGFSYLGGVYFDHDPLPGYSILVPLVAVIAVSFLKAFFIHVIARLFEGNGRYFSATGSFRGLIAVIGYAGMPSVVAILAAMLMFVLLPGQLGYLISNFHPATISVFIALGIGLFIWNLILMVLALRPVYPMRDLKLFAATILGPVLMIGPGMALKSLAHPVEVKTAYVAPLMNEKMMRIFAADPSSDDVVERKIDLHMDSIAYKGREPRRFEYVFFIPERELMGQEPGKSHGSITVGKSGVSAKEHKEYAVGRIVGMPGEQVELQAGKLKINGVDYIEPYVEPEFKGAPSVPLRTLGPSEFLVLPADRKLIDAGFKDLFLSRDRILGRMVTNRLPFGWWFYRPAALQPGFPEGKSSGSF
jgi:hypothetical protein